MSSRRSKRKPTVTVDPGGSFRPVVVGSPSGWCPFSKGTTFVAERPEGATTVSSVKELDKTPWYLQHHGEQARRV